MANEKEICLAHIEILRHKISSILITALNHYWKDAAFKKSPLDRDQVIFLIQTIHECAQDINELCQAQNNHVSRHKAIGRKRSNNSLPLHRCKHIKLM